MNNQLEYYKNAINQCIKEAFSGQAQDVQAYDLAVYYQAQYDRIRLDLLEEKRANLWNRIYGSTAEAQDIDGMIEIAEIEQEIEDIRCPNGHPSVYLSK